ncbi:hypothetical protein MRX96_057017 [Rhipicephalus microplus]
MKATVFLQECRTRTTRKLRDRPRGPYPLWRRLKTEESGLYPLPRQIKMKTPGHLSRRLPRWLRVSGQTLSLKRRPGSRSDLSKFYGNPIYRITVTCRNYILARVFERARLCSDLRDDAAADGAIVSSLQAQLVEERRESATMQRRVTVAGILAVGDVLTGVPGALRCGAGALAISGGPIETVVGERTAAPLGAVSGMSYAAALGSGTRPGAKGPSRSGPAGPQGTVAQGAGLRQDYVASLTPVRSTNAQAREVARVLKSNINLVAKGIRHVTLRHTRYGVTVFSHKRQSLLNMQNVIEQNTITRNVITVRVPDKRNRHVRF